jgi:hypothetical protein
VLIYGGGILKNGTAIGTTPACCCGDACCSCSVFDPVITTGGSGSLGNLTIDLSLSDYDFCTDDSFVINMRIRNTTAFTVGDFLGGHQPQIIIGNRIKSSPTDVIDPGNYVITSTTPSAFSIGYESRPGSQPCPGNRVVVSYGLEVYTPGFDKTYTVSVDVLSTRLQGNSPLTPAGIHGQVASISFGQKYATSLEISSNLCSSEPEPEPCTCCFELVPWSEGECDKSEVPGFVNDIGLTAVSVSDDPWCNGVTLTLTLTFTNNSGFANDGAEITFDLTATGTTATCTSASDGGIITPGFSVVWTAGAWPNGGSLVRTLQMTHSGCLPGIGSITSDVYAAEGYRCSVGWLPVECPDPCDLCTLPGVQDEDDGGNPLGVSFTSFPSVVCCEDSFSLTFQDVDQGADTFIKGTFVGTFVTITGLGGGTLISGGNGTTDSFDIDFGPSVSRTLTITISLSDCSGAISGDVVGGIFANDGRTRIDWPANPCI